MNSFIINGANEEACHKQDNIIHDMPALPKKAHCQWLAGVNTSH